MILEKIFLQLGYECVSKDKENLDALQKQMLERINYLSENDLNSNNDSILLEYYELHSQIQQCIFQDHGDQYLLIIGVDVGIPLLVFFRWRMIKKWESKNK